MEQEIRFCNSADGTRIAYATYGNDAARTLVFVQSYETAQEGLWTGAMRSLLEGSRRAVGSSRSTYGAWATLSATWTT